MSDDPIDIDEADSIELVPGGELSNMFLVRVNGETKPVKNTPKNKLLYKHGLYDFLYGDEGRRILSAESPYVAVKPLPTEGEYKLWYDTDDMGVIVSPSKAEKLLRGIVDALENDDYGRIHEVYSDILNNQVRRQVINPLSIMYPQSEVVPIDEGWVIRGLFKVTWDAGLHLVGQDLEEGSYVRGGGGVRQTDDTRDLLQLEPQNVPDPKTVRIAGDEYTLTELEMEFIAKVEYLLNFEEHIDDPAFIKIIRRQVSGDVRHADEDTYSDDDDDDSDGLDGGVNIDIE